MDKQAISSQVVDRMNQIQSVYNANGITLKKYQIKGIKWMLTHEAMGNGAILADEPGLGKTFQSLATVVSDSIGCSLVAVPSSTLPQWTRDAKMLLGQELGVVYVHHGGLRRSRLPSNCRIVLTTPETLLVSGSLHDKYKKIYLDLHAQTWRRIIIDEVHVMKNSKSKLSECAMQLKSKIKWGLSGTPVQNKKNEIINLFKFVTNTTPGSRAIQYHGQDISFEKCCQHLLKRRKKVDKLQIAEVEIENYVIDFKCEDERNFYQKIKNNIKSELMSSQDTFESAAEEMAFLFELLLRLRQTAQHPQLVIDGYTRKYERQVMKDWTHGISSKHQSLLDLIRQHPEDGSVVFSQFTGEMDILEKLFKLHGYRVSRIDGSLNQHQKAQVLNSCANHPDNQERPDILLIQIKAGGVGLNLQAFNRVYITTPDWNPANEDQAIARCWRMGQKKKVIVKKLVLADPESDNMIDNRILTIQESKRKLHSDILQDETLTFNGNWSRKMGGSGLSLRQINRLLK